MERRDLHLNWTTTAALVLAMALAQPAPLFAQASQPSQSANDFQLPPGQAPLPPPAAGPIDPEQPAPAPVQAIPAPLPQPEPALPSVTTPASPPPAVLPKLPNKPAVSTSPPPTAASEPAPAAQPARSRSLAPEISSEAPPDVLRESLPAPSAAPPQAAPATSPAAGPTRSSPWALWLAAGALLALLLAGGWGLRPRRDADEVDDAEGEDPLPPVAETPMPTLLPGSARAPFMSCQIELVFEPQRLTMALVNATLAYRLSLTNRGDAATGPVSIGCDIISAHASLGDRKQILTGADRTEPSHQFRSLDPGETIALTSNLQLPIAAIRPIRSGEASIFVPLARFCMTVLNGGRPPLVCTRVFVIGESPEQPGQRLRPIRIDKGPRTLSRISQRELELPA